MPNAGTLAIITARGGSKRIPRKNIRPFRGKPMMAWPIAAAQASGLFDHIMVSTDDDEIAQLALDLGADVPFRRSSKNADDFSTTADVLIEVLEKYQSLGRIFTSVCCLYPTAPFVQADDIKNGYQVFLQGKFDVVLPVVAFDSPIWRSLRREENGKTIMNFQENMNTRSQDLPLAFHDVGQWYWFRPQTLFRDRTLLGANTGSIVLPAIKVQDIDTEEDWQTAEWKHERLFGVL